MNNLSENLSYQRNYGEIPGAQLIQLLMGGDKEAFEFYYKGFYPAILNFVLRRVKLLTVAEEIANNSFVTYWNTRETIPSLPQARSYIYTTARNESINWLKKESREENRAREWEYVALQEIGEDSNEEIHAEVMAAIESKIAYLPTRQRLSFRMYYIEGMKLQDVACILGISESTTRTHISRAVDSIRDHVHKRHLVSYMVMTALLLYYLLFSLLNILKNSFGSL